jgi:hypothetical protein
MATVLIVRNVDAQVVGSLRNEQREMAEAQRLSIGFVD